MLILAGKTCSGKTTLLHKFKDIGIRSIPTFTTRKMRAGEVNGDNYYFITEKEFQNKIEQQFFVEYTKYNVATGETWYYGTSKESLKQNNGVIILNPEGVKAIKKLGMRDLIVCYIKCDEAVLKNRLIRRGDDVGEAERRLEADRKDFIGFENYAQIIVNNNEGTSIDQLVNEIYDLYQSRLQLSRCIECGGVGVNENGRYCDKRCEEVTDKRKNNCGEK